MTYSPVPPGGPLMVGAVYRRRHLNDRFGGNRMSGIARSPREPVVLLFHTEEPSQQFYRDGFDGDGVYWYSGEGVKGDMKMASPNVYRNDRIQMGATQFLAVADFSKTPKLLTVTDNRFGCRWQGDLIQ